MAIINGTDAKDYLNGTTGADTINAFGGNDIIKGSGGADRLNGGDGIDLVNYFASSVGVFVSLINNLGSGGYADGDTFNGIENVTGSVYDDSLWGDDGSNTLTGLDGRDTLKGYGGNDELIGYTGDDFLYGMNGFDRLFGDSGADILDGGALADYLDGGIDADTLFGGSEDDQLFGQDGNDTLNGDDGNDWLEGGLGADALRGGRGNDTYVYQSPTVLAADVLAQMVGDVITERVGEGTEDRVLTMATYVLPAGQEIEILEFYLSDPNAAADLVGNEFGNTIIGSDGSNTIVGSPDNDGGGYDGLDVMTGRFGGDVFVWTSTAESGVAGNEADVITDFNRAQGDLIAVNPIDADVTTAGNQAFTFVGTGPFTAAGQISTFTTATDTYVLLNTDGDAAQEMTIRLVGVHAVDASWFVL